MISNPKAGWCTFKLDNFVGSASYITDVPVDLLQTFINYEQTGSSVCSFDEEGSTFIFVIENCNTEYIISERQSTEVFQFNKDVSDLEKEVIKDIESDLDTWGESFEVSNEPEDIDKHTAEIKSLLYILKHKDKISTNSTVLTGDDAMQFDYMMHHPDVKQAKVCDKTVSDTHIYIDENGVVCANIPGVHIE